VGSSPLIDSLDVVKYILPGLLAATEVPAIDPLPLHQTEPAFHRGIVLTVASANHRTFNAVFNQKLPGVASGI
jgi:hypothetical protein